MWAILLLRSYLKRSQFTVRTDHEALNWLLTVTEATGTLAGWRPRLLDLDLGVVHHAGTEQQEADNLSRLRTGGGDIAILEDEIAVMAIFDHGQTQKENSEDDYDKENSENH